MHQRSPFLAASRARTAALLCAALASAGCSSTPREEPRVVAIAETTPVASLEDAADDPAVWRNDAAPERSLILGTDKRRGLCVYDLTGELQQELPVGRVNNVDVRDDFALADERFPIVAASHRDLRAISLWRIDDAHQGPRLAELPGSPIATGLQEPYGLCLARAKSDGRVYAFVSDKSGAIEQWLIEDNGHGVVAGNLLRTLKLASQVEGLAADEQQGALFIGEEGAGVWRVELDPSATEAPVLVARVKPDGPLTPDVEGIAIAPDWSTTDPTDGLIIVSSQGANEFDVFDRRPPHRHRGVFHIARSASIDGVQETDGLDASTRGLGPLWPRGLLVVQDGDNSPEAQNFKLVAWEAVLRAVE
jgi:3-phytase